MTSALVLAGVSGDSPDLSWLRDFGIAAPFAALCFWMVLQTRKDHKDAAAEHAAELAKKDAEITRLHGRVEGLQAEALQREQQLVAGLGPRIYDAARLIRESTGLAEQVAAPPAPAGPGDRRLAHLTALVERLVDGMGEGDAGVRPPSRS